MNLVCIYYKKYVAYTLIRLYFCYMGSKVKLLPWIIVIGLLTIRFSIIIDDPEHMLIPHADCPICQAYQSQVLLDSGIQYTFHSIVLIFISELPALDTHDDPIINIHSIRAPPFV
jgi:hypothetical protein